MSKPATTIYRFCQQASEAFDSYFTKSAVDQEKIWLELIAILSHSFYSDNLLFRHYAQNENRELITIAGKNYHPEAWFYVTEVLLRRISLANKMGEKPTNMHELLMFYLRASVERRWQSAALARGFRSLDHAWAAFFQSAAAALLRQCRNLSNKYGEISKRRRLQYGPYWLSAEDNHTEVPEEMSLSDVLEALPLPLKPQMSVPTYLLRVVETLNERYALLRSCGLPPEHWFQRDEFSISQLKQLKQLIKEIRRRQELGTEREAACRDCFKEFKAQDQSFIGFESCEAFYRFYAMETTASSLYQEPFDHDTYEEISSRQSDDDLTQFREEHPQLFNQVTAFAFDQLVVEGTSLKALLQNPQFKALINYYPEYASLSEQTLLKQLQRQLNDIREHYIGDGA